jgi:Na+/proline symporter
LRVAVLLIALVFIGGLAALTITDFVRHGITGLGVVSVLVLILFTVGIVGALRHPPQE